MVEAEHSVQAGLSLDHILSLQSIMTMSANGAEAAIGRVPVTPPTNFQKDLDRSLIHGIAWTGAIKWITQVLTWGSTIVVARVLSPADYGLVAIASTFIGFIAMINEFGLGTAVITKRDLDAARIAQLNGLAVLLGAGGFLIACIMAAPMSRFFDSPNLSWVLVAMGTSFLIGAFRTVPSALLEKEFQFKSLAMMEGGQAIIASLAVIVLALFGAEYWALVAGIVVGTAVWTALTLWHRTHAFRWPVFRSLGDTIMLSWHLIVMRVTWYTASNADRFIVGKFLGQAALGSYTFASTFANVPLEKIGGLVSRVTPAFFSSLQTDHTSLRRYILNLTEGLALVTFPATIGLALVADDFVALVLGAQWATVVMPLQILAGYAAFRSIMTILSPVLLVTGLSRLGMMNSIWSIVALLPAFYCGSQWGINGVAVAWLLTYPFLTIPIYSVVFKHIGLSVDKYLLALWPAVSATLVMVAFVLFVRNVVPEGWPRLIHMGILTTVGGMAYLGTAWAFHRERARALIALVRTLRH